jgi:predicted PurR-regulated permease PerM
MERKKKRSSSLRRRLKYLLLLLLLSFNFTFAFGYIQKLNQRINELNQQVQTQQALINQTDAQVQNIQKAVTLHEMKINILSKAEPSKVIHTITKVVESVPNIEPSNIHLVDPTVVVTTVGVVVKLATDLSHGIAGVFGFN